MRYLTILLLCLGLFGCPTDSCDDSVGPDPIPGPAPDPDPIEKEPAPKRVDRRPPLRNAHIFTFFGATLWYNAELGYDTLEAFNAQPIAQAARYALEHGYNTGRIGAQTDGWCDNGVWYLPCGPPIYSDEWEENLKGMLELTSRIEGFYVELIPTFTHKSDLSKQQLVELTKRVVRIAQKGGKDRRPYKHIIWEAFNEFVHPGTREKGNLRPDVMIDVLDLLPHPRGADLPDNHEDGDNWRGDTQTAETGPVLRFSDYAAWHPSRNPEPSVEAYRRTMAKTALPVLFDETVSWVNPIEAQMVNVRRGLYTRGTPQEMRRQVNRQQRALCEAGAACSFHFLGGFCYESYNWAWFPQCPCN